MYSLNEVYNEDSIREVEIKEMKTVLGKWRLKNGEVVEIKWDENMLVYYAIIEKNCYYNSQDCLYYSCEGECYRDRRIDKRDDVSKNEYNYSSFVHWDLDELIEEKVEEKVVKRNSNPIFMLDVCTE
jgi:hypothetical protein